jgi:MATE family multidrug resistance protein
MRDQTQQSTLTRLLYIAFPMVISQASDTVMKFVDRLFVAGLGDAHLAATMSGGLTEFMISSLFIGTVGYVGALVAQYYGSGQSEKCAEATFQAVFISLLCYPLLLAVAPAARYLYLITGQTQVQIDLSYTYLKTLIFGSLFLVLRFAMTGFFLGIGRTTVVMIANAAGVIVNVPANYILIYGKLGVPALGLKGAAIGTILGNAMIFVLLLLFYLRAANRKEFGTHQSFKLNRGMLRTLIRFGVPAGFEMFLGVTAFNLFLQFMHSYGTDVAAAITITFNWDIVAFVPMLGMGHATTALVGQNIGALDYTEAKKSTFTALKVAWVYSCSMVVLFIVGAPLLVSVFAGQFHSESSEIADLAVIMLRLAALYTLADSAQLIFTGALRAAGDTRWVMKISIGLHWAFSVLAVVMIKVLRADPVLVWISFILFIISLGLTMFFRFRGGKWQNIEIIER